MARTTNDVDPEALALAEQIAQATGVEDAAAPGAAIWNDELPPDAGDGGSVSSGHNGHEHEPEVAAAPPVTPAASRGRPATLRDVVKPTENLRIMRVDENHHEQVIGTFTAQEIASGGGDFEGFCARVLGPQYGGGRFRAYTLTAKGAVFTAEVGVPAVIAQPQQPPWAQAQPPWYPAPAPQAQSADPVQLLGAITNMTREQQERADQHAREEAAREAARWTKVEETLLAKDKGGDSLTTLLMLQMMRPAAPPPAAPPKDDRALETLGKLIVDSANQNAQMVERLGSQLQMTVMQMQSPPPPPPPAPPPGPTFAEQVALVSAAVMPVITPLITMMVNRPDPLTQLAGLVPAAAQAGLIGGPKITQADVNMAEMKAKLDMMANQGGGMEETLGMLQAFAGFMQGIQPRAGAQDWIAVIDRAIDRGPEIVESFGALAMRQALMSGGGGGAVPAAQITQKTGKQVQVPLPLVKLRNDVLAVDFDAVQVVNTPAGPQQAPIGRIKVIQLVVPTLAELAKAGKPWQAHVEAIYKAAIQQDTEGVLRPFAQILLLAWGKGDPKTKTFFARVKVCWEQYSAQIAQALTSNTTGAAPEDDGGDPLAAMAEDDAAAPDETAAAVEDEEVEDEVEVEIDGDAAVDELSDPLEDLLELA